MRRWLTAAITALVLAAPSLAHGALYEWQDDQGTVHYADDLDRVPARFRGSVREVAAPSAQPAPAPNISGPPQGIRIGFTPGAPILVQARINDAGPVVLVLDTGADRTMVAPSALRAIGLPVAGATRIGLRSVTGVAEVEVVEGVSVAIGPLRVGPLAIIAHDAGLGQAHGLLGRDFLDRVRVTIDSQAGTVTLTPP